MSTSDNEAASETTYTNWYNFNFQAPLDTPLSISYQEYIIEKEGRVSTSVYCCANALRIIKSAHPRKL